MGRYFTRASKLIGLEQIAAQRGVALGPFLDRAKIDPAALRRPDAYIDYEALCELLEDCAAAWDLPDIGLRMARHQHIDILGPVALIARMERNVRDAINQIIANLVVHSNVVVAALDETGRSGVASLVVDVRDDARVSNPFAELLLAEGRVVLDSVANGPVDLIQVEFHQRKGGSAGAVGTHFGCPVVYDANRNAMTFDRSVLDRPIERMDMAYHALVKRYLRDSKAEIEVGPVEEVRIEIARQMELGICTLDNVAQGLHVTSRSLQRRLKDNRTSFRDLLDAWRRDRALSLVTHTRLPLSEVSIALGYSEQSVFTQAFRRWFGRSPLRVRHAGYMEAAE
ncbi:MAG: AraC family transcriptional regulator ligand-binding domain-containing protein [Rhizobiaceae bacterium]